MEKCSNRTVSRRLRNSTGNRSPSAERQGDVMARRSVALLVACLLAAVVVHTQEAGKLDYAMFGKIRDEGLNHSQALDHVSWLADVYGPRLQGSPAMRQAAEWVEKKLGAWGLVNAHEEKWPFGRGWA